MMLCPYVPSNMRQDSVTAANRIEKNDYVLTKKLATQEVFSQVASFLFMNRFSMSGSFTAECNAPLWPEWYWQKWQRLRLRAPVRLHSATRNGR